MPTTTEEFYQVLKAFKERDPNGNGKADEIPYIGTNASLLNYPDAFLMNAFIYNNYFQNNFHLMINNGKVDAAFNKPEWKEGVKYINKLFKEGLMPLETFTQDLHVILLWKGVAAKDLNISCS
jgi:putative aldouronate transport system substrate-binding protein